MAAIVDNHGCLISSLAFDNHSNILYYGDGVSVHKLSKGTLSDIDKSNVLSFNIRSEEFSCWYS